MDLFDLFLGATILQLFEIITMRGATLCNGA